MYVSKRMEPTSFREKQRRKSLRWSRRTFQLSPIPSSFPYFPFPLKKKNYFTLIEKTEEKILTCNFWTSSRFARYFTRESSLFLFACHFPTLLHSILIQILSHNPFIILGSLPGTRKCITTVVHSRSSNKHMHECAINHPNCPYQDKLHKTVLLRTRNIKISAI